MPCPPAWLCWACATIPMSWLCPSSPETPHGLLPRAVAVGDRPQGASPTTPFPFLLPRKPGGREAGEHCCAHTAPQKTCVFVPRRAGIWAVGFARALVPLSISAAVGCSGKVLRHSVGAGHPKTGQVSRQKQVGPPPGPAGTKEYLFIPSGAAPSGEAPVQPWLGRFWLDGACGDGGAQPPGGPRHCVGASCPCSTLLGDVWANQTRAVPTGYPQHSPAPCACCWHLWVLEAEGHPNPPEEGVPGGCGVGWTRGRCGCNVHCQGWVIFSTLRSW